MNTDLEKLDSGKGAGDCMALFQSQLHTMARIQN